MPSYFSKIKSKLRFKRLIIWSILFVIFLFAWSNFWIHFESKSLVFDVSSELPSNKVGLVLGTSPKLKNGRSNPFFNHRINAVVQLYKEGKIQRVLISGDNGTKEYNEPEEMRLALIAKGIPDKHITLDYAGFDTYDSVLRANKIFGQSKFTVISQRFHAERAVYIGRRFGFEVVGFSAKDVSTKRSFKTHMREYFARVKAYVEVKLNVDPYFLGESITIE